MVSPVLRRMLSIGPKMGVTLEAKGVYLFPATGFVLQPSLGYMYGF